MPQADANYTTTLSARRTPILKSRREFVDPNPLPRFYALGVRGNCLSPTFKHGDTVIFDKEGTLHRGQYAAFYYRPEFVTEEQPAVECKRLLTAIPSFIKFPRTQADGFNVSLVILVEQLNPALCFEIMCSQLLAVHRCVGRNDDPELRKLLEAEGYRL